MLVTVVEAFTGDLGELTSAVKASGGERVRGVCVKRPIGLGGWIASGVEESTIVEQPFVGAVPGV